MINLIKKQIIFNHFSKLILYFFILLILVIITTPKVLADTQGEYESCLKNCYANFVDNAQFSICQKQCQGDFPQGSQAYKQSTTGLSPVGLESKQQLFVPNVPVGDFKGSIPVDQEILGKYLNAWYKFVVGVVGILATVIMMWGGFKWLTSRGNAAAIGDAKDRIWSAVIGLVLVFLSYNLLWIINPKLVEIKLPTLNKGNSTVINTDNNLDNDKDVMSQLAQWSYDTASILPPGLEEAYIGMETSIEWLVRQNDQEALKQYLASHNINIVDSTGLLQANTQDLVGISRMGNTFGEMNVEYLNGGFILDANQANIINGLMDRDGVANGENGNNFTTNVIDAGGYQITRITDLNFDYADNRGNIYNYEISATGNRNNDGRWELRFQQ